MSALRKGLILAALQVGLVSSLGAKLLWDRAHLPRAWAPTLSYDPDLFIRGRYIRVQLLVKAGRVYGSENWYVTLTSEGGRLTANPTRAFTGLTLTRTSVRNGEETAILNEPVVFFIPEHAQDPSRHSRDEELWVEVTIPKKGPPRPIRLAIKKGDSFTALDFR